MERSKLLFQTVARMEVQKKVYVEAPISHLSKERKCGVPHFFKQQAGKDIQLKILIASTNIYLEDKTKGI